MSKWKIMISAPYMQPVMEQFRSEFEQRSAEILIPEVTERLSENELLEYVGDIDGVIAGDDHFSRKVLEKATPLLKVISKWGTGIDAFDLEACQEFGVQVCNTPDAFTKPVADSVLGYLLSFARQLPWMNAQMKAHVWDKIPGKALSECTLGIIGLGNIGSAVARRAKGFDMKVLANDIRPIQEGTLRALNTELVSLEKLLKASDFVSVNCDLNPGSFHLINAETLAMMRDSAVLINMARGPIVDEVALIDALQAKQIGGAALDVFEHEPLPEKSPLREMENVMLAPHNSNSSPTAWGFVHRNSIDNLFRVLEDSA